MKYPAWVYIITHNPTGKKYVGISSNPRKRISCHLSCLRNGKHPVEDMQSDYYQYGGDYSFQIVSEVKAYDPRRNWELHWQLETRSLEREHGYNYKDPTARYLIST